MTPHTFDEHSKGDATLESHMSYVMAKPLSLLMGRTNGQAFRMNLYSLLRPNFKQGLRWWKKFGMESARWRSQSAQDLGYCNEQELLSTYVGSPRFGRGWCNRIRPSNLLLSVCVKVWGVVSFYTSSVNETELLMMTENDTFKK